MPRTLSVAITGSTGLIGSALARSLRRDGHRVLRVVRARPPAGSDDLYWDPRAGRIDAERFAGLDAVVHLAGESVGERWTEERKRRIRESRVRGTRLLAEALAGLASPPPALLSASAVGYYGDRGDEVLHESSAPGTDFLAQVCREWEEAAEPAAHAGIRVVHPRFGVVLSARGGALQKMLLPFRLGVGGPLGGGRQWMSWISLGDTVAALRFALDTPALAGPVNIVAPEPVRNSDFTRALGRVLRRPTLLPVPAFALEALFGEMADASVLASQRALPTRLSEAGFGFRHPTVETALRAALEQ